MITNYFKMVIAKNIWGKSDAVPFPSNYYMAISFGEPSVDGTGVVEPTSDPNYKRVVLNTMSVSNSGKSANEYAVIWPKATAPLDGDAYWAMFDAETGGNLLMSGQLVGGSLTTGASAVIDVGGLVIRIFGSDEV